MSAIGERNLSEGWAILIPKATEDTITSLLKDELEKSAVKVELFPSVATPVGTRKPDLVCRNAGAYPIEAKFSERDLLAAIAKIQNDYLKHHRVLGIKGGFAILYPEQLTRPMPLEALKDLALRLKFKLIAMFPPEDVRPFKVYESSLLEIVETLKDHILAPPKYVEPSINYIIESLRESATYLLNGLRHLTSKQLEGFFGGKDVFKNILQYEEGKYPVEELKLAAAYLLVNQLLFYHSLSKLRSEFPEIDPETIQQPAALNRYFEKVLDVNYRTVFSYDVASLIPPAFLHEVRTIVNVINGLSTQKVGGDLLGTIFHDLIPFETRKNVAAFYTNVLAAELLAFLAIDTADAKVADFAVGSGGLLVAAYRRKKDLLKRDLTQEIHKRFVEDELLGIDVMPFAANVAACHLALQSPQYFTDKVSMAIWDSTDLRPGRTIPSVADLKTVLTGQSFLDPYTTQKKDEAKGVVALQGKRAEKITLGKYDVVIMNPPFTRQERIPKEYKRILLDRFNEYKESLHGQLGYYGYFILLADRFLEDGGRMSLVLPATVLRVPSCEGLRKLLAEKYHVEYIVTTWHRSAFSESVFFREILFVARKSRRDSDAKTVIAVLKRLPRLPTEAKDMASTLRASQASMENDIMSVRVYDFSRIRADISNWFKYAALSDLSLIDSMEELLKSNVLVPLSSKIEAQRTDLQYLKFIDFHGFILHGESRARKRIDAWILEKASRYAVVARHRELGWKVTVPVKALGRGLRRVSYVDTIDVSDTSDYVALSWFDGIKDMAKAILSDKELRAFGQSTVRAWLDMFDRRKSHVLFARRFDLSATGTSILSFYSDNPVIGINMWHIKDVTGEEAKILTLWLNSTLNLLQTLILRVEARGAWMTVHDYVLGEMLIPDFVKLSEREMKHLLKVFENIKGIRFPSILDQLRNKHPSRRLIDTAWLRILGYKGDVNAILDNLYESLANEIELLKRIMAEGEAPEDDEESE